MTMEREKAPDGCGVTPPRHPTATELATIAAILAIGRSGTAAPALAKEAVSLWEACDDRRKWLDLGRTLSAFAAEDANAMFKEWPFGTLVRFFADARPGRLCEVVKEFDQRDVSERAAGEGSPTVPLDKFLAELMPKKSEADRYALYRRYWTALGLDGAEQIARDKESGVPTWRTRGFAEHFHEWQQAEIVAARREAGRKGGQRRQAGKGAATRPGPAGPATPPQKRR